MTNQNIRNGAIDAAKPVWEADAPHNQDEKKKRKRFPVPLCRIYA